MENNFLKNTGISTEKISSSELVSKLSSMAREERLGMAKFLRHLAEFDLRRLYADEGYSSCFVYLTEALHFSEGSAQRRLIAARLTRLFPFILERIALGGAHLTAVGILAPVLTQENHRTLILQAEKLRKLGIEQLAAQEGIRQGKRVKEPRRDQIRVLRSTPAQLLPVATVATPVVAAGVVQEKPCPDCFLVN